jgi:cytochrome c-type biogenesis protein CcmH
MKPVRIKLGTVPARGLSLLAEVRELQKRQSPCGDSRLRSIKMVAASLLLLIATPTFAQGTGTAPALANQQLENPAQEVEATRLMHSLRCIQCQGQSIADSDAPMAATMRAEVRQQIASGKQADDIRSWMIGRYGEWVSFEPAMHGAGLLLWAAPLIVLLIAGLLARGLFRRRRA